ncbi:molybdate ABC transporter, permease protein [Burkholderia sp. Ch1-1]|uniref:Molybdenum transport system permease n=1 Tax=Paraburkholderia dioscoreae TaxID=2604047 RepID=A0A5Q4Z3A8_9BURK|nr:MULTISPECIES: molybdate ABC transporter permease subunit [Paraburkholderia]EIF33993.1 molybdate ABC transporter, permease protein [Burkholderia sp. Ch1-1]MDR8396154.1 molybdate ABC transporter permease subunit [Paraburkholderia sp. USG1]VVD32904.1 molybdate transporter subunit; membrane component of ABC superfamily [Paraburkholderia dioscoreae]
MSDSLQNMDWSPLLLSLKVAGVATVLALAAGIALGWIFARRRFPGSAVLEAVCMLPLVLPPTVIGYGLLVAAGRRSVVGAWLYEHFDYTIVFNWHGAVAAAAVVALPLVLKSASASFAGVDPTLEAAARTLRQSPLSVFVRITLPLAWPGILAGTLLAFARALGEFGATLMVAGDIPRQTQTLSMAIYDAMQSGQDHTALLLVLVTSGLSIAVMLVSNRFFSLR